MSLVSAIQESEEGGSSGPTGSRTAWATYKNLRFKIFYIKIFYFPIDTFYCTWHFTSWTKLFLGFVHIWCHFEIFSSKSNIWPLLQDSFPFVGFFPWACVSYIAAVIPLYHFWYFVRKLCLLDPSEVCYFAYLVTSWIILMHPPTLCLVSDTAPQGDRALVCSEPLWGTLVWFYALSLARPTS